MEGPQHGGGPEEAEGEEEAEPQVARLLVRTTGVHGKWPELLFLYWSRSVLNKRIIVTNDNIVFQIKSDFLEEFYLGPFIIFHFISNLMLSTLKSKMANTIFRKLHELHTIH